MLEISIGGSVSHSGSGSILPFSAASDTSIIMNLGQYTVQTDVNDCGMLVGFNNGGTLTVTGNSNSFTLSGNLFSQQIGSTFFLNNSIIESQSPLILNHGEFIGGGIINAPLFNFNSSDGLFLLSYGDKSLMEVNVQKKETDMLWRKLKPKKIDLEFFDKILRTMKENLCQILCFQRIQTICCRK